MAISAEDCALMLDVMTGHDEKDSTSLNRKKENYSNSLDKEIEGLRIGIPKEFFEDGLEFRCSKID